MFIFGNPEDTARTLVENFEKVGFGFPDYPVDEQTEYDLKRSITVIDMAVNMALKAGTDEEVVEVLLSWYEEAFTALVAASKAFREFVASGKFQYPGIRSSGRTSYYRKIAASVGLES